MLSHLKDYLLTLPTLILILILLLTYSMYTYLTSNFDFWLVRGVPYREPAPLFGNFKDLLLFRKSQPAGVREMYDWFPNERYFGVFRVRQPMLMIRDPEIVKSVCVKDFQVFCNRAIPVNSARDPLAGHLFNLEGKPWKSLRCKLTPAFSSGKLKKMLYLVAECSDNLTRQIDRRLSASNASTVEEIRELAANYTIDVIGSCAFGIRVDEEDTGLRRAARRLSKPSYKATLWRMLRTSIPRMYKFLGVQVIEPEVTRYFVDVVRRMIEERETMSDGEKRRNDFMDLLVELKNKGTLELERGDDDGGDGDDEFVLDENTIAAQAFVFFVAGYETSSNTIAFCLHELAVNPEIQDRTRRDIEESMEEDGKITYEAVQAMKYLDMVIMETLRKYPPAPLLSRRCEQAYKIPGSDVELPTGMRVVVPIYGIHHDPSHYPEPESFVPERFSEEGRRTRRSCTYLPFGEGPRSCIGMRFALLQTKIGVISFLRRYKVEVCERTSIPVKFSRRSLVTTSEDGIWLRVSRLAASGDDDEM